MTSQDPEALPSNNQTARELAALLGESEPATLIQLRRVVGYRGREFVMEMYRKALETEAAGGMIHTHTRTGISARRTLGGVFFWHVKQAIGPEKTAEIFPSGAVIGERVRAAKLAARAAREAADAAQALTLVPSVGEAVAEAKPEALKPKAEKKRAEKVVAPKAPPSAPKGAPRASPPPAPPRAPIQGKKRGPMKMPEVFHTVRTK